MGDVSREGALFFEELEDLLVERIVAGLYGLVDLLDAGFRKDSFDIVLIGNAFTA